MKKIGLVIVAVMLLISITACQKEQYDYEEYGQGYYKILEEYERFLDEDLYIYIMDSLSIQEFYREYNHKNARNALENYSKLLDNTLYELTQLALLTDDEKLLINQSKLEYALEDIYQELEEYRANEINQTIAPNRYALLRENYNYLYQIQEAMQIVYKTRETMEDYLADEHDVVATKSYKENKQKNIRRFLYQYYYAIVSTAGLEENIGMHISPQEPFIYRDDKKKYLVYEYNLSIINTSQSYYNDFLSELNEESLETEVISEFNTILNEAELSFQNYVSARLCYAEDFYRSKDFINYQKRNRKSRFGDVYDFDYDTYSEYGFEKMRDAYFSILGLENNEVINQFMYTEDEIQKFKNQDEKKGDL